MSTVPLCGRIPSVRDVLVTGGAGGDFGRLTGRPVEERVRYGA
ncbi:hypothetical protein ACQEVS_31850 [Streptomyces sp. CA-181903]